MSNLVSLLCFSFMFILVQGASLRDHKISDEVSTFLKCLKKNMVSGNATIGLPSFNPLRVSDIKIRDFYAITLNTRTNWDFNEIEITGLDQFNHDIAQISQDDGSPTELQFSIQWPALEVLAHYNSTFEPSIKDDGKLKIDVVLLAWKGSISFTTKNVEKMTIEPSVLEVQPKISNKKPILELLLEEAMQMVFESYLNNDEGTYGSYLETSLSKIITENLLQKPEVLKWILSNC